MDPINILKLSKPETEVTQSPLEVTMLETIAGTEICQKVTPRGPSDFVAVPKMPKDAFRRGNGSLAVLEASG